LVVALPSASTREPAAQVAHGAQLAAFVAVLKVPAAHATHVRLVVALPSDITEKPAPQSDFATQAVAGFAS
jgi:hypothetical protein